MDYFPPALENLVEQFAKLPGVGRKSAQRLALYLLGRPEEEAKAFADAILQAKGSIGYCPKCQNLTQGEGLCSLVCAFPIYGMNRFCCVHYGRIYHE